MEPVEDLRVVRGPDWEHGEEDGGEGHVGTVAQLHRCSDTGEASGAAATLDEGGSVQSVTVQWDMGHRGVYKCGQDGKYELRIFDTAQAGK